MASAIKQINKYSSVLSTLKKAAPRSYYTYSREPAQPIKGKEPKWTTPKEAIADLKSGNIVFVQGAAATPVELLEAMTEFGKENKLKDVTVCHMHTEGNAGYHDPSCEGIFRSLSFFMGGNCRKPVAEGRGDAVPIFLSEIPQLFYKKIVKPDIAMIQVSPPDEHGYCSLGTSVDCVRAGLIHSDIIIALVNKQMPRTFGDGIIHISHIDYAVKADKPLATHGGKPPSPVESKIGQLIAENLVEDGATLQMGIGNIPDAVLSALKNHKDLGIHSEMFADGVVDLVANGSITNTKKRLHQGRIVGSFLIGTQKLYDFVDNNPFIEMLKVEYVNSTSIIAQQPKMTAINSCIEVDLTGQVNSDSIGTRMYSGFGGQVDFIRGAAEGLDGKGKPIIALPSVTNKNQSKISPILKPGIGSIPNAALMQLVNHKDLGIHSELFTDVVVDLVEKGCVTNSRKTMHQGHIVATLLLGQAKLYQFVHENPFLEMLRVDYVNHPGIIAQQPIMTAINSCIQVDLTGQVNSDSIGTRIYSGFGGQVDFISGAARGLDGKGKAIIALPSTTKKGRSKIVPILKPGAGVVTTRGHVRYVVTEYGIVHLFGKCFRQRAHALISIAHPDHREMLEKAAFERFKVMPSP